MKSIIVCLVLLFAAVQAHATDWSVVNECCQWSGTEGVNCLPVKRVNNMTYITLPNGLNISTVTSLHLNDYYPKVVTEPALLSTQAKDAEVWAFENDEITLTWTVRAKTDTEIAQAMSFDAYRIWKVLISESVLTTGQITPHLTQAEIDAYLARQELGQ